MSKIKFNQNEYTVAVFGIHWFIIFKHALTFAVLTFIPFGIYLLLTKAGGIFISEDTSTLLLFLYLVWVIFYWVIFFFVWTDYHLDAWIITNLRVIDVEQKGLFHRNIATLNYDDIEDITMEINGILRTLLNYGHIYMQTAGAAREFSFTNIEKPYEARDLIYKLQYAYRQEENED